MSKRDDIVMRSGIVYVVIVLLALSVIARIAFLQMVEGEKWASLGESFIYRKDVVRANRGDILAADGRILATSVPYYSIYFDTRSTGMADSDWYNGIDGLARGLSGLFGEKSATAWRAELVRARDRGDRYHLIRRRVSHSDLKELQQLPIFRLGKYRGGLIINTESRRVLPNGSLAARTLGYLTEAAGGNVVGLEGAFDGYLSGTDGVVLMQRLTGGDWLPVNERGVLTARDGMDIVSTIDIDLQDVAHSALTRQLTLHNARHGTAVLMEVRTGDIKSIVNLELGRDGRYHETYNYAVGESTEPGSTFKLPALMAALETGRVDIDDIVDTGDGTIRFYNATIRDSKEGGYGELTVKEVFELSSNVGTAKIIEETFRDKPTDFVDRLYSMKLNERLLNDQIRGEGTPVIRYPGDRLWSGLSLPMMSHGYEVQQTPLQILTFYNAVANDGRMMRPRFVTAISYHGTVIRDFSPEVISPAISSRSTISKVRVMLEGVVENGTATNLKNENYKIAGKTGTAQIANERYGYRQGAGVSYQASFVGYFPAENPLYSCIVVVNAPSNSVYYGNLVAGPVFKEIADKVYSKYFYRFHEPAEDDTVTRAFIPQQAPVLAGGDQRDIGRIARDLGLRHNRTDGTPWVKTAVSGDTLNVNPITIEEGVMPDITGFTLRDAMYLLENSGWRVRFTGMGRVVRQSPSPGSRLREGATIYLELRL